MEAIEATAHPSHMCVRAGCSHPPHVPVFYLDVSSLLVGKVGLGNGIKVREEVPTPRLLAFPSWLQGNFVRGKHRIAIVLAVFMTRYNRSHDDVQWYTGVSKAKCTFEDEPTLHGHVRPFIGGGRGLHTMIL